MATVDLAGTQIIKCATDQVVPPNMNQSMGAAIALDGYRYMNVTVQFEQQAANEPPVELSAMFAYDTQNTMGARCYVNLGENPKSPQKVNAIQVSGAGSWHGVPKISSYIMRIPVLAPYAWLFALNRATVQKKVSVWVYLVS
ncbi:MAG: hypothetical protein ABSB75_03485 [Candidatus Limnocylindrales bacterium]